MGSRWLLGVGLVGALAGCGDEFSSVEGSGGGGSTSTSATAQASSSSRSGMNEIGCADGARELMVDPEAEPHIAGCAGSWDMPGLGDAGPQCGRMAGDDFMTPGTMCGVEDLCAEGWHVCKSEEEVVDRLQGQLCTGMNGEPQFWLTKHSSTALACTIPSEPGNIFGCGTVGQTADCMLPKVLLHTFCGPTTDLPTWSCGTTGDDESISVMKGPGGGGVLCCATLQN